MTISKDDEKAAREWLDRICDGNKHARTIWRMLDHRVMPAPEDVPWAVLGKMRETLLEKMNFMIDRETARALYAVGYDHYHQPPAPKRVEAWAVVSDDGRIGIYAEKPGNLAIGSRIVHLREVESEQ